MRRCSNSPVEILVPGIQGTGISWETITEKERQDITNRILSPVQADAEKVTASVKEAKDVTDNAKKVAKDAVNEITEKTREVNLLVGDLTGTVEKHFTHDFGVWGDDDTRVEIPVGNTVTTVADNIESVKTVGNNIEAIKKTSEGIGQINDIMPYTEAIETIAPHIDAVDAVAPYTAQLKVVGDNEETIKALANTLGLQAEAKTLVAGRAATVTKEITDTGYKLTFGIPKGDRGDQGIQGYSGTIKSVEATVDNRVGTPEVEVILEGTPENREITFNFKNMKGEQGIQGEVGPAYSAELLLQEFEGLIDFGTINGVKPTSFQEYITAISEVTKNLEQESF